MYTFEDIYGWKRLEVLYHREGQARLVLGRGHYGYGGEEEPHWVVGVIKWSDYGEEEVFSRRFQNEEDARTHFMELTNETEQDYEFNGEEYVLQDVPKWVSPREHARSERARKHARDVEDTDRRERERLEREIVKECGGNWLL